MAPNKGMPYSKSEAVNEPDVRNTHPLKRYHLLGDLYRGIVLGAYAVEDLYMPGMLAWIVVGFVPGLGTLAALRDGYYSLEVREWAALFLNLIGLVPFMKGITNLVDGAFIHRVHQYHRVAHVTHQVIHASRHGRRLHAGTHGTTQVVSGGTHGAAAVALAIKQDDIPSHNSAALPAVLLSLVTTALSLPLIGALLLIGYVDAATPLSQDIPAPVAIGVGIGSFLWSVAVLALSRHARSVAKRLIGQPFARGGISTVAVWLAWFDVVVNLLTGIAVLLLISSKAFV